MSSIRDRFTIGIFYKPSIPDNITNSHVFNDDQQILHFIANIDVFKDAAIDDDEHERSLQAEAGNMKSHIITKGVASLEKLYEMQERLQAPRNNKTHSSTMTRDDKPGNRTRSKVCQSCYMLYAARAIGLFLLVQTEPICVHVDA